VTWEERGGRFWYALSLVSFVCALMSKTAALIVPASLLCLLGMRRGKWRGRTLLPLVPMFLLGAAAALQTILTEQHPLATLPVELRPLLAVSTLSFYVGKLLLPLNLLPIYPRWEVSTTDPRLLAGLGLLVLGALVWRYIRIWQIRWGLTHFVCALLPVLGLVPYAYSHVSWVADRHVYLASAGFFLAVGLALDQVRRRISLRVVTPLACGLVLTMAIFTRAQLRIWRDSGTLWTATLAGNPNSALAHNNLSAVLMAGGQVEAATEEVKAALDIWPDYPEANNNLALVYLRSGDAASAVRHLRRAAAAEPTLPQFQKNLGRALEANGELEEAEQAYRRAIAISPQTDYLLLLGDLLVRRGKLDEASETYRTVLMREPQLIEVRNQLGRVLLARERWAEAARELEIVVRSRPDGEAFHFNLALALRGMGRDDAAERELREALRLRPDFTAAREALSDLEPDPTNSRDASSRAVPP